MADRNSKLTRFLPNVLTILRMACAVLLILVRPLSALFFTLYAFAGVSDVLDGYFARRFHVVSELGARLDSAADFLLIAVLLFILIPLYDWPLWILLWMVLVCIVRFAAMGVCFVKFHRIAFLHTWSNKTTGLLLFFAPILLMFLGRSLSAASLLSIATISAIEELWIELSADTLDLDRVSLFHRHGKDKPANPDNPDDPN